MTVSGNATGRLNRPASAALGDPEFVALLWDQELKTIGIRACSDDGSGFRSYAHKKVVQFSMVSFVRHFDLPWELPLPERVCLRGVLVDDVLVYPLVQGQRAAEKTL